MPKISFNRNTISPYINFKGNNNKRYSSNIQNPLEYSPKTDEIILSKNSNNKNIHNLGIHKLFLKKQNPNIQTTSEIDVYIKEYENLIKNAKLHYNPLNPPQQFKMPDALKGLNVFKFSEAETFKPKNYLNEDMFNIKSIKQELDKKGSIEINFPQSEYIKPVVNNDAKIDESSANLGKLVNMNITLDYGKRVNWPNRKIARDIMQNFYDGHGNTLDGVKMKIEKLPNGESKIRIEGKGIYEHSKLIITGDSQKSQNRANAGGFGEGTKVLSNVLLGKNITNNIKYGSSNWIVEYCKSKENSKGQRFLLSKTTMAPEEMDGNFIEFTTKDNDLVDSIIESINYFKHSKNPDFKEFDFLKGNFGFSILDPEQKGNIYLTQRFEYNQKEGWENKLEGLKLFFNEKPDLNEFCEITGKNFDESRDRLRISSDEISDLVYYYTKTNMTNKEIANAIISTAQHWESLAKSHSKTGIGEFLQGLIKAAKDEKIGIDFEKEKFVAATNTQDNVVKYLESYGYKFAPKELAEIGLTKSEDMFKYLSVHKPIQPNEVEIKKLVLLEEAMKETLKKIDSAFFERIPKLDIKFNTEDYNKISYELFKILQTENIEDFIPYHKLKFNSDYDHIKNMSNKEIEKLIADCGLSYYDFFENNYFIAKEITKQIGEEKTIQIFELKNNLYDFQITGIIEKINLEEVVKILEKNKIDINIKEIINQNCHIKHFNLSNAIEKAISNKEISIDTLKKFNITPKTYNKYDIEWLIKNLSKEEITQLSNKIGDYHEQKLLKLYNKNDKEKLTKYINKLWENTNSFLETGSLEALRTLKDYCLITKEDVKKPRYLFNRFDEIANRTLGESISDIANGIYNGHWADKTYFDSAQFDDLYATWLHEICHKGGGDGTSEFTYILTDMIKIIASSAEGCDEANKRLKAIEKVFNSLPNTNEAV